MWHVGIFYHRKQQERLIQVGLHIVLNADCVTLAFYFLNNITNGLKVSGYTS